jgi:hypothetical protein
VAPFLWLITKVSVSAASGQVHFAPGGWPVTSGGGAAFVAVVQRCAHGWWDDAGGASDVHGHSVAAKDHGDDFRVAREAAQGGCWEGAGVGEVADAELVTELFVGQLDDEVRLVRGPFVAVAEVE